MDKADQLQGIDINEHHEELKEASEYFSIKKIIRKSSYYTILFGLTAFISVFAILESKDYNNLSWMMVIIGGALLCGGLYTLFTKSPIGLRYEGASLIAIGLFNIYYAILDIVSVDGGENIYLIAVGIWQIALGRKSFTQYNKYVELGSNPNHQVFHDWIEATLKHFKKKKETIKIVTNTFRLQSSTGVWQGLLLEDGAVFKQKNKDSIEVAPRDSIELEVKKMKKRKGVVKLSLFDKEIITGTISKKHADKFMSWKDAAPDMTG